MKLIEIMKKNSSNKINIYNINKKNAPSCPFTPSAQQGQGFARGQKFQKRAN